MSRDPSSQQGSQKDYAKALRRRATQGGITPIGSTLLLGAADEIERLRREVKALRDYGCDVTWKDCGCAVSVDGKCTFLCEACSDE